MMAHNAYDRRRRIRLALTCSVVVALCDATNARAQPLPFFPGAEGYGGSYSGAPPAGGWLSNAEVYHVTNLSDDGPGSFRNAFIQNSSNRIIVFDVAGTVELTSGQLDIKNLGNYYIAGQTAPGPVTIYGDLTQIGASSDKSNTNVILRYLSFRRSGGDVLTFKNGNASAPSNHMIIDHASASWSEDEILSVANAHTEITVQYTMIHDALTDDHAFGSLIRPQVSSEVTFHHNLYANNASRQPRFGTYNQETLTADFRNNVVYNWRDLASYSGGSSLNDGREFADVNYVGNYLVAGPGTEDNENIAFEIQRNVDTRIYQSGNEIDWDQQPNPDGNPNGTDTGWGMFELRTDGNHNGSLEQLATPLITPPVATQSALDAYWQVVNHVGNYWWDRDQIDGRVIGNVLDFTNPPGGLAANSPPTAEVDYLVDQEITFRNAGYDVDGDAMPGAWERDHGLDPDNPNDWNLDFDNDGYINLIEFINEAGEFPAPTPIVFTGEASSRYAEIFNWRTDDGGITPGSYWQPSRYDEAQIPSGTAVVDAVGQHAGSVKIGKNAGEAAMLQITNGWLKVEDAGMGLGNGEIVIGDGDSDAATLDVSGGTLTVVELSKGAGGTFLFTGGTLRAEQVNFDLDVKGGTVAPGSSIGTTTVDGNVTLMSGSTLQIEFDANGADQLVMSGDLDLSGNVTLDVQPLDGTTSGSYLFAEYAGMLIGTFDNVSSGYTVNYSTAGAIYLTVGELLAGDYNDDGIVNAADYVVWRNSLTGGAMLNNETASPGVVDQADYEAWKANFGAGAGTTQASGQNVPEPAAAALMIIAATILIILRPSNDSDASRFRL